MPTLIGIDPGVNNLGLAAITDRGDIAVEKLTFPAGDLDASFVMSDYLRCRELRKALYAWLVAIIPIVKPVRVAGQIINGPVVTIEGPAMVGHKRLQVGFLHQAIYDAVVALRFARVIVAPPMVLKKYVTGKGNAGKLPVIEGILRKWFKDDIPDFGSQDLYEAFALAKVGEVVSLGEAPKWMMGKIKAYSVGRGEVKEV